MSTSTEVETHKAAKAHRCTWCWQRIDPGSEYKRYRWWNGGDARTERMHPECHAAMREAADEAGGWIEWIPGNERPTTPNAQVTGRPSAEGSEGEKV